MVLFMLTKMQHLKNLFVSISRSNISLDKNNTLLTPLIVCCPTQVEVDTNFAILEEKDKNVNFFFFWFYWLRVFFFLFFIYFIEEGCNFIKKIKKCQSC